MNQYPWLDEHLMSKPGTTQDFKLEWQWQRYLVRDKMFAAVCTPDIKYEPHNGRTMVIVKCDPMLAEVFRTEYPDVVPGFYSDKRCWNSVYLDGAVPDDVLKDMLDMSYRLVTGKLTKTVQRELGLIP